jgi:hypothetical protein
MRKPLEVLMTGWATPTANETNGIEIIFKKEKK